MPIYSILVLVHNEEEVLSHLFEALYSLSHRLDGTVEFVFVDDGSTDDSRRILGEQAARDARCRIVRLSRNFGHQVAVTAGLDTAKGDAVVIIDADLQDPPAVVLDMARRWRGGYDVVYGQRVDRDEDTRFKRMSAGLSYKLVKRMSSVDIPEQVGCRAGDTDTNFAGRRKYKEIVQLQMEGRLRYFSISMQRLASAAPHQSNDRSDVGGRR